MSETEVIGRICTVALLVSYLIYMQWRRALKRVASRQQAYPVGLVIDVAPLRPRVEEVRRSYTAVAHVRARSISGHEGRVADARQKLSLLSFFRHQHAQTEAEHRVA